MYWMFVTSEAEGSETELVALVGAMIEVLNWGSEMLVALIEVMDEVLLWGSEMLVALVEAMDEVLFWGSEMPLLIGAGSYGQAPSRF